MIPGPYHGGTNKAQRVVDFYFILYHKTVQCQEDWDKPYKAPNTAHKMQALIGIIGEQVLFTWSDTKQPKKSPLNNGFELSAQFLCFHLTLLPFNLSEV